MNERDILREMLYGVRSHMHVLHALEGLEPEVAGERAEGSPHTIQQILMHMVYWQDISLARMRGEHPPTPATSAEGWDFPAAPVDTSDWEATIASFAESLRSIEALVADENYDLDQVVRREGGQSAREQVLMVQAHNSYHLGQIVQLRCQLGAWPPPKGSGAW